MGEVVETGWRSPSSGKGTAVIVPFPIACGRCFFCTRDRWACCDNSNPDVWMAEKLYGFSGAGLFGYSHLIRGYADG